MAIDKSKIILSKEGESVVYASQPNFDDIEINLNWNRAVLVKPNFWQRMFGNTTSSTAIDLDVGCLYELKDGRKSAVQALGNAFGHYDVAPYINLLGDDRDGSSGDGETIRINGKQWHKIKRIVVYAFIYEGAPNWDATDALVTISTPGEKAVEVRITSGDNRKKLCGIVLLENDGGGVKMTRLGTYHNDQSTLDFSLRWGLNWQPGRK